ncbi:MAG: hypothetical protein ACKPDI_11715, partial [Actinomycetota bacterium]
MGLMPVRRSAVTATTTTTVVAVATVVAARLAAWADVAEFARQFGFERIVEADRHGIAVGGPLAATAATAAITTVTVATTATFAASTSVVTCRGRT